MDTRYLQAFRTTAQLLFVLVISTVAFTHPLSAQVGARAGAGSDPTLNLIQRSVNSTTLVVARFEPSRIKLPAATQTALAADPHAEPLLAWLTALREKLAPVADDPIVMLVDVPFSSAQAPVRFVTRKPAALDVDKLNAELKAFRFGRALIDGDLVSTAPAGNLVESNQVLVAREMLPPNEAALTAALAATQGLPIQVVMIPPDYLRSTYVDLMPQLPSDWGGVQTSLISEGLQWAALGVDLEKMNVRITIQSKNASAAERLKSELPTLAQIALAKLPMENLKSALTTLKLEPPLVKEDKIEITISNLGGFDESASAVAKIVSAIVDPLRMQEKTQRFRQLALAIHNYESANRVLPPNQAARRADGTSPLSWRVHILPYLGETELYLQFKLNEAWDSPHNKKLLDKMPEIFSIYPVPTLPTRLPPGYTTFVAPVGEGTMFGGTKPMTFSQVQDGTSNTIFFVEVQPERAVPWTAPMDYEYLPANPADGLAIGKDGQFICVMADGSVHLLPGNLPKQTLIDLFQINDGHAIQLP